MIMLNRRAEAAMLRDDGAPPATIDNGSGRGLSPNNPLTKPIASIAPVLGRTSVAQ